MPKSTKTRSDLPVGMAGFSSSGREAARDGQMGRRRRRGREPAYVWWSAFGALLIVAAVMASWRLALITLGVWCLYELSLNPTICRIRTREGHTCDRRVRGRLYACCDSHQELKNDALWTAAGLHNPFRRPVEADPNRDTGVVVFSPSVRARVSQDDLVVLGLAALGTIAVVIGMVVGLLV